MYCAVDLSQQVSAQRTKQMHTIPRTPPCKCQHPFLPFQLINQQSRQRPLTDPRPPRHRPSTHQLLTVLFSDQSKRRSCRFVLILRAVLGATDVLEPSTSSLQLSLLDEDLLLSHDDLCQTSNHALTDSGRRAVLLVHPTLLQLLGRPHQRLCGSLHRIAGSLQ